MLKKIVIFLGICISISFTGCNTKSNNPSTSLNSSIETKQNANNNIQENNLKLAENSNKLTINTIQDVKRLYRSIDDLTQYSQLIIEGKIQDTKVTFNQFGIYTNATISVTSSFSGNFKKGDLINVTFRGGTITGEDAKSYSKEITQEKFGKSDNTTNATEITELVNSLDNVNVGDDMLLFLNYIDNQYSITGAYQGRFKIKNTNDVQLHEEFKNKYKSLDKNSFINLLKQSTAIKK